MVGRDRPRASLAARLRLFAHEFTKQPLTFGKKPKDISRYVLIDRSYSTSKPASTMLDASNVVSS